MHALDIRSPSLRPALLATGLLLIFAFTYWTNGHDNTVQYYDNSSNDIVEENIFDWPELEEFESDQEDASILPPKNLTYPLPLPYALRETYTDAELETFIPPNCPGLPWKRNLTTHPVLVVAHSVDPWEVTRITGNGASVREFEPNCPWDCTYTSNVSRIQEADAQYYSIFSNYFSRDSGPISIGGAHERRCPMQRYIFKSQESEANYDITRDAKLPVHGFDLTITYRQNSDVPQPYYSTWEFDLMKSPLPFKNKNKTDAIGSAFISNCGAINGRTEYLRTLIKLLSIDSYGSCMQNKLVTGDISSDHWEQKKELLPQYLFTLAFENSNSDEYVTEKMYQALEAGTVPVYMGTDTVTQFVPSNHSIIKVSDFKSPEDLATYLLYLRDHPREYERYLEWKETGIQEPFKSILAKNKYSSWCRLCGVLSGENVGW